MYNGPPSQVRPYFEKYGLRMSNHSNPADKLSIIAAIPKTVLNPDITIDFLSQECKKQQMCNMELSKEEKQSMER